MSAIYFHAKDNTAAVRGRERAVASVLISDLLSVSLGLTGRGIPSDHEAFRAFIAPGHYLARTSAEHFGRGLSTALAVGDKAVLSVDGKLIDGFTLGLNTALAAGGDVLRFMARIHGQCEIHAYVEGANRSWLAGIIERGRAVGLLREESGWEAAIDLLRSADDGPVVTSYSVCEQFPSQTAAERGGWERPEENEDAFCELPFEQRWDLALAGVRAVNDGEYGLEMNPENWDRYYFGDGLNGFQLLARIYELRRAGTDSVQTPARVS